MPHLFIQNIPQSMTQADLETFLLQNDILPLYPIQFEENDKKF